MKLILFLLSLISYQIFSQELYLTSEAASSEAKNRKIISFNTDFTNEGKSYTPYIGVMYGINGHLTSMNKMYYSRNPREKFIGDFDFGFNYRFFTIDKKQFHYRMSVFTHLRVPSAPAQTNNTITNPLFDHLGDEHYDAEFPKAVLTNEHRTDNWSPYIGYATTILDNKFAANLNLIYNVSIPKGDYKFGNFFEGGLAFGYLVFPRRYKTYNDVNFNVYFEPKFFYFAKNEVNKVKLNNSGGWKTEITGGVQFIFTSAVMLELGYTRSAGNDNIKIQKDVFFTSIRYLFF